MGVNSTKHTTARLPYTLLSIVMLNKLWSANTAKLKPPKIIAPKMHPNFGHLVDRQNPDPRPFRQIESQLSQGT